MEFVSGGSGGTDNREYMQIDLSASDNANGPAYIVNVGSASFDVDGDGVAAAASAPTWTNRALYGSRTYEITHTYTGRFALFLRARQTTTFTDDGIFFGVGVSDNTDPASATNGFLMGWQDDAAANANVTARASGTIAGTINGAELPAGIDVCETVLVFAANQTTVNVSGTSFNEDDGTLERSASTSGVTLDVSGGTIYVHLFAGHFAGTPSGDLSVAMTLEYFMVDLEVA